MGRGALRGSTIGLNATAVIFSLATITAIAGLAAPAWADGGPVLGAVASAEQPIALPGGGVRYVARTARASTVVRAVARDGRSMTTRLPGHFGVPIVAYDGATSGLSADGRTLVLIRPRTRFPEPTTRLAVLAARSLRVKRYLQLRGDFTFDANSPNGRWIYLIQFVSAAVPGDYRVRALDPRTGRLLGRVIVDPDDAGEAMRGNPIARATSPDGRWAYTLYDGLGHPFVHALDTVGVRAKCIDLPKFPPNSNWYDARIGLGADGRQIQVTLHGRTLAALSTTTLKLHVPARAATRRPATAKPAGGMVGIGFPIAAGVLALGSGLLVLRRRFAAGRPA
jgi:hypothetical protein